MMMTEDQVPRCRKCEEMAFTQISGIWLCKKCLKEFMDRQQRIKEKIILEE